MLIPVVPWQNSIFPFYGFEGAVGIAEEGIAIFATLKAFFEN